MLTSVKDRNTHVREGGRSFHIAMVLSVILTFKKHFE
jgi:hypothetical protein